jgi:hypothetical protein
MLSSSDPFDKLRIGAALHPNNPKHRQRKIKISKWEGHPAAVSGAR